MRNIPTPLELLSTGTLLLLCSHYAGGAAPPDYDRLRARMVAAQLVERGIRDERVLDAMRKVPRHEFVPYAQRAHAYRDTPLPIGAGQTISQPYVVALMTQLLRVDDTARVLEVGTGSGYQAAILGELAGAVFTIELERELAQQARSVLQQLGYTNVHTRIGDGYLGWEEHAPFDAIMVTAAPDHVPQPLIDQLRPGGVMVIPVGPVHSTQQLRVLQKDASGRLTTQEVIPVRFVPLRRSAK